MVTVTLSLSGGNGAPAPVASDKEAVSRAGTQMPERQRRSFISAYVVRLARVPVANMRPAGHDARLFISPSPLYRFNSGTAGDERYRTLDHVGAELIAGAGRALVLHPRQRSRRVM